MMWLRMILTVLIGIVSGVMGGALGNGGTFMMVPGLILFNIIPDFKMAVGTTIIAMLPPISILAAIDYHKRKQVDYLIAGLLCISYVIAAKYGGILNNKYSDKTLKYWSAAIFFLFGFYFLYTASKN